MMATVVGTSKLPTSFGGIKSYARRSGGVAVWISMIVLGAGAFFLALPWLMKIPFLGPLFGRGATVLPGQAAAAPRQDEYGTVMP